MRATIAWRRQLHYRAGADPAQDRPAHLRAGSSLSWIGDRLALVQDDANFVALVDPRTGLAEVVTLPAGEQGLRQFDDARGNKRFKVDLEACCAVPGPEGPRLIAMGSGSGTRRRTVLILDDWHLVDPRISVIDADDLYRGLEETVDFSGSDMNIEGALALPHALRLFGRGNGTPRDGRVPVNATCDLPLPALLAYFAAPGTAPAPSPTPSSIERFDLGSLEGLSLGFTDATMIGTTVLYTAAAEDSANAREDGRVSGSVLGVLPGSGDLRHARLTDARGVPTGDKVEGLASVPGASDRVFVVVDADDATRPSELCEVILEGPWR